MRKLLPFLIIGGLAVFAYQRTTRLASAQEEPDVSGMNEQVEHEDRRIAVSESSQFRCDGRQHCSQMSSCEEATWFLEHCPGMKMDGDGDGIPCEDQHCGH